MHIRTQSEFDAFLKVKVYDGWQEAQISRQIDALREAGVPVALLKGNEGIEYMRSLTSYLLFKV